MPPIPTSSEFTDKTSFTAGNLEETTTNDIFFYWGSTSTDLFINITTELSTDNSNPYPKRGEYIQFGGRERGLGGVWRLIGKSCSTWEPRAARSGGGGAGRD